MVYNPPPEPDDTQPTLSPSRPTIPRRRPKPFLSQTALLGLIIITTFSLIGSILLVLRHSTSQEQARSLKQITLVQYGIAHNIHTQAATVGDFLREQAIELTTGMIISAPPETALLDDMTLTIDQERLVSLSINGIEHSVITAYSNPADILSSQGIQMHPEDRIYLDGTRAQSADLAQWPIPVIEIEIWQAVLVTVLDGEQEVRLMTSAKTVGDALFEANIILYLTDHVSPDPGTPLSANTQIVIDRALPVRIEVDGTVIETRVQEGRIADALTETGIALVGFDYTIPAVDQLIVPGLIIEVRRVTEAIESSEETIPYETIFQASPELELDNRQTIQSGQIGIRQINERIRFENGVEVGREPAGTEVVRAPIAEIIAYGTQVVIRTIDTPDGPRDYWRKLRVYATSYKPEALGGDNITAIGMTLQHGVIGADPRIIPYRTNMYVPGYGTGIMADTGGPRSSPYWIDLGYSDEDFEGWHWYVDLYLLTPVPDNLNYLLPAWRPMRGLPDR